MDYHIYQLNIKADRQLNAAIASLLENAWPTPLSVSHFENENHEWLTTAHYDEEPDCENIASLISKTFNITSSEFLIDVNIVKDMDWVSHVQQGLKPVRASRFFIYGSHDRSLAENEPYAIEIDAAQAFGTAHHGTTKGCLEVIDGLANDIKPNNILDLGTGTGVLAIAAAKCWPSANILATDIDQIAVDISKQNATLNAVEKIITHQTATGLDHKTINDRAPFDLIIANILAKPLLAMASDIGNSLTSDGTLLLSGLLDTQKDEIKNCYQNSGLTLTRYHQIDEWGTCLFVKTQ